MRELFEFWGVVRLVDSTTSAWTRAFVELELKMAGFGLAITLYHVSHLVREVREGMEGLRSCCHFRSV